MPASGRLTITVDDGLRLVALDPDTAPDVLLTSLYVIYQDVETVRLVDGPDAHPYDLARMLRMYRHLHGVGELYVVEECRDDGWTPIGDATLSAQMLPIVLATDARGRGIGRRVLESLVDRARVLGWAGLCAHDIHTTNVASTALFSSVGFVPAAPTEHGHGHVLDLRASASTMPAPEVLHILGWLSERGIVHQVNGGWAVDALVGHQTRVHRDLDVFVDADHVDDLLSWLATRGYAIGDDWRPVRVELAGPLGRVDVHPMRVDAEGNGLQQGLGDETFWHPIAHRTVGRIGGQPVTVADADHLRRLHEGYPLREVDRRDLALLDRLDSPQREDAGEGPVLTEPPLRQR